MLATPVPQSQFLSLSIVRARHRRKDLSEGYGQRIHVHESRVGGRNVSPVDSEHFLSIHFEFRSQEHAIWFFVSYGTRSATSSLLPLAIQRP